MKSFKALLFCIMALCLTIQSCKTKEPTFEQVRDLTYDDVKAKIESPNEIYKNELLSYEITYKDYGNSGLLTYLGTCDVRTEWLVGEQRVKERKMSVIVNFLDKDYKDYDLFCHND